MANISEALTNEFEAQKTVYLKGNQETSGNYIMKRNKQYVYVHYLPGYLSQIEFRDASSFYTEKHEKENMIPCSPIEFLEAFENALSVINSKL